MIEAKDRAEEGRNGADDEESNRSG